MSDIGRHVYVAVGTGPKPDRCAECYLPEAHAIHAAALSADTDHGAYDALPVRESDGAPAGATHAVYHDDGSLAGFASPGAAWSASGAELGTVATLPGAISLACDADRPAALAAWPYPRVRPVACSECGAALVISATRGTPGMPAYDALDGDGCASGSDHMPGGYAECVSCWNLGVAERRAERKRELAARPDCEACGKRKQGYTLAGVGMCRSCSKRAQWNLRQPMLFATGWAGITRERVIEAALAGGAS